MQPGSERWTEVTASRFAHERAGLDAVRQLLPDADPYRAWSNVEIITDRGRSLEIDLLVVGPGGLYVVELKAWSGRITGDRYVWQLRGDRVLTQENPWRLVNDKAKVLKGLLDGAVRRFLREKGLRQDDVKLPWVQAAVLLHSPQVRFEVAPEDRTSIYGLTGNATLPSIRTLLTSVPGNKDDAMTAGRTKALGLMLDRIGMTRRRKRRVGAYLLDAKVFAEGAGYQDFLAVHERYPDERVRVRVYGTGTATTTEERTTLDRAAEREYRLFRHLGHPGLITPSQHTETDMGPALVYPYDDADVRLDHLMATQGAGLDLETRLALVRGLTETLRYAHGRHITHRGFSPQCVWVGLQPSLAPRVRVADWQTGAATGSVTGVTPGTVLSGTQHVGALLDATTQSYQAPEAGRAGCDEVRLDVFALGATAYLIVTGRPPAPDPVTLRQRVSAEGGLDLTAHVDAVPDALRELVLDATRGDVAARLPDMEAVLDRLAAVEREVRAPEAVVDPDPLEATPGALLAGRFSYEKRLGGGSTAVGLLVTDTTTGTRRVLKVARDEDRAGRLRDEAEVLRGLNDPRVARLVEEITVGGRTALVLEAAGETTLAALLRETGRLSLDRLERFGADLLAILDSLDSLGVTHRDIKPDNLGVYEERGSRQKHLRLFDFSLSRAPASDVTAGTEPYLDPFLGAGFRRRYDVAAERYAAAVTLFEMATGRTPAYGDGRSHPSQVEAEASVEPGMFDPGVAAALTAYFTRALAREAGDRFGTVEEMRRAWQEAFTRSTTPATQDPDLLAERAGRGTALTQAGLSARALSALEPLGLHTVGDLVDAPAFEVSRTAGVNEATRRELRARAKQWRDRLGAEPEVRAPVTTARSVDGVVDGLIPAPTGRNGTEVRAARLLLGRQPEDGAQLPPPWPSQGELAEALGVTRVRAQQLDATLRRRWASSTGDSPLAQVRDDLVAAVDGAGGVATAAEAANALLALRGSVATEPLRFLQALGLVRAAVESELERGGAARLDRRRRGDVVLLATEAPETDITPPASTRIDHAIALGRRAVTLAETTDGPVPSVRAVEALRQIDPPEGMAPLDDARLLRLAAGASGSIAVSARDELYRRGLDPAAALRHSGAAYNAPGGRLPVEALAERVRLRFSEAAPLPPRPALDGLLDAVGSPLVWADEQACYIVPAAGSTGTSLSPRIPTWLDTRPADSTAATEVTRRLRDSVAQRSFLALGVEPRLLDRAPDVLAERFALTVLDVTGLLLDRMRALASESGIPWDTVLAADAAEPASYDGQGLRGLVAAALPAVDDALAAATGPVLLVEAAPLARYDALDRLARLADHTTARAAAVWLLLPADDVTGAPTLDREPVPVYSPAQWLRLPASWVRAPALATGGPA